MKAKSVTVHTKNELKYYQSMSLEDKIDKTKEVIKDWVKEFQKYTIRNWYTGKERTIICGEDDVKEKITQDEDIVASEPAVYVSFSGGKDSTVLLHLVRQMYPDIEAVFVNTGLEYPEIQTFAKSFDNVTVLRPKMRFDEVIREYGYPFISKDIALTIYYARRGSQFANERLNGIDCKTKGVSEFRKERYGKWKSLAELDFNISHYCCGIMKEKPLDNWCKKNGKVSIVGTLAEESERRADAWLKTGCNAFESKKPTSKPLSFWTNQDILSYIKQNNLPIASVYGDVVYGSRDSAEKYNDLLCDCGKSLCTTKCDRTGCIFCGFGAHLDKGESRFQRLKKTHPRQYEYCMGGGAYDTDGLWKPTKEGLGMAHCIDEINKIYGKNFIRY